MDLENGRLFEVGANSRLGANSNKYGITRINNFNYASRQPVLTNQKHVVELLHTIDLKRREIIKLKHVLPTPNQTNSVKQF